MAGSRLLIASHQPCFLPWGGFIHKMISADVMILRPNTPYKHDDFHHRVKVDGAWLRLPVSPKEQGKMIGDVVLDPYGLHRVARAFETRLWVKRFPHRQRILGAINCIRAYEWNCLSQLNTELLHVVARLLDLRVKIVVDYGPAPPESTKTERVLAACQRAAAGSDFTYLAGAGAREYLEADQFDQVLWQEIDGMPDCSILELIAKYEDPIGFILEHARWAE